MCNHIYLLLNDRQSAGQNHVLNRNTPRQSPQNNSQSTRESVEFKAGRVRHDAKML